jgi:hypothetical protein
MRSLLLAVEMRHLRENGRRPQIGRVSMPRIARAMLPVPMAGEITTGRSRGRGRDRPASGPSTAPSSAAPAATKPPIGEILLKEDHGRDQLHRFLTSHGHNFEGKLQGVFFDPAGACNLVRRSKSLADSM